MPKALKVGDRIDRLVDEIRVLAEGMLDQRLLIAKKLLELRAEVESRGDRWWPWFEANKERFISKRKDTEKLLRIASSPDPEAAMRAERDKAKQGMAKKRKNGANVSSRPEPEPKVEDGNVWIKSACGNPLYETPFKTVEEAEAAWEASRKVGDKRNAYLRAVRREGLIDIEDEIQTIMQELREIAAERAEYDASGSSVAAEDEVAEDTFRR
jgi:hypothetical protein